MFQDNEGVPIRVGGAEVRLNTMLHNLGEVKPFSRAKCSFTITNVGPIDVVLGRPSVSCSCIASSPTQPTTLSPNAVEKVELTLTSTGATSQRQLVTLRISEPKSGSWREVPLSVVASQREIRHLTAERLDFGSVLPGAIVEREIVLQEVATDRFGVLGVDVGTLPIECTVDTSVDRNGYRAYKICCKVSNTNLSASQIEGELRIATDSEYWPVTIVPVVLRQPPPISLDQSVLAFGKLSLGRISEKRVDIRLRLDGPVQIELDTLPAGVSVKLESTGSLHYLAVTVSLAREGIWRQTITGRLKASGHAVPFALTCAAIGISSSPDR